MGRNKRHVVGDMPVLVRPVGGMLAGQARTLMPGASVEGFFTPAVGSDVDGRQVGQRRTGQGYEARRPAPRRHLGRPDLRDGPGRLFRLLSRFTGCSAGCRTTSWDSARKTSPTLTTCRRWFTGARAHLGAREHELPLPLPGRLLPLGRGDITSCHGGRCRRRGEHDPRHHRTPTTQRPLGAEGDH